MPPTKTSARKPRHRRRTATSSDDECALHREARSSSESSDGSDSTLSSSEEDALDTPVPPVSPRAKKHKSPVIPDQPTSWSELVDEAEGAEPPIIDFADFVENGVAPLDSSGPSHPVARGRGRGNKRGGGGKTQRQAYLDKLSEDPSFIPRVGAFWGHDERLLAPELRGMSDWWRGKRGGGRGRGRGRGGGQTASRPPPEPQSAPSPPPIERTWGHDGFEKLKEREQDRVATRGRGRGRGRGGSRPSREPEQLWTKAPDTHLHIDPSTRPQFPGQGRGIKVNLPGQWRPEIVRVPRGQKPTPSRVARTESVDVPTEIVVKLPGKSAQVVAAPRPAEKEEAETVQPLEEAPPKPVARIPAPAPKTALPTQVLNQPAFNPPEPTLNQGFPPAHGRTRSQQDAVAFAQFRSPTVPTAPISFGSVDMPALNPGSAPPPETQPLPSVDETTPKIHPPASAPLPSASTPLPAVPPTSTPPVANYYNPYAYTPLDGATYYSTATPPPPPPHMYYPPNGFFVPPRPSASVTIRAPGNGAPIHPPPPHRENGQDDRAHPPVWNYYPHPGGHGHNPYYSPSGTPYPGYYPEYAHGAVYDYPPHGAVYY